MVVANVNVVAKITVDDGVRAVIIIKDGNGGSHKVHLEESAALDLLEAATAAGVMFYVR